ncbi:MAG: helix-turn-helix domain-containing protein [Planctomycetales bacterium]|nr:helix-turn-helix domain-containing protein [Planctomycetales bacterium]
MKRNWRTTKKSGQSSSVAADEFFTTTGAAKHCRVGQEKILNWIRSKQLKASNVGEGDRPQWRISRQDLYDFLESRSNRTTDQVSASVGSSKIPKYV